MKKINCGLLLAVAAINIASAKGLSNKKIEPSASIQKMWIDYDAKEGSRPGMLMHISFTTYDLKGSEVFLGAYFRFNDDKADSYIIEKGIVDNYHTKEGQLAAGKYITPTYDASVYTDMQIFMPYDVFNLDPGTYQIAIDVKLVYRTGIAIAWLKTYEIEFTAGENSRGPNNTKGLAKMHPFPTTGPRAVFDSMWVDYDVMEDGVKGMRLHFKFTTYDMKDVQASVAAYFVYNDDRGGVLKDNNNKYVSSGGDVAVYKDINPGYATTVYDDLQLFMPYSELDLKTGTYQLAMDTKLIYRQGGLVANFDYRGFRYTEP